MKTASNSPETKTYRVLATMETDLYLDVEASSREEAMEIARNADAGEFREEGGGDFRIYDANEVTPSNHQ